MLLKIVKIFIKKISQSNISRHIFKMKLFSKIYHLIKIVYYISNKTIDLKKVKEISKLYYQGKLNGNILDNYTYGDMFGVKLIYPKRFRIISNAIYNSNIERVKHQLLSNQKQENTLNDITLNKHKRIKIGFLVFSAAMWNCDELYHFFEKDEYYEPIIYVRTEYSNKPRIENELYNATLEYFQKKYSQVVGLYAKTDDELDYPDLLFHQQPYTDNSQLSVTKIPLSTLNMYIPYSISVDSAQNERYTTPGYTYSWKVFCSTQFDLEYYHSLYPNDSSNGVYLGYPKADSFIQNTNLESEIKNTLWKLPKDKKDNFVKIIYAPHHSIGTETIQFSTFAQNYMMLYEYAKNHQKTTSWIIKPHPALKYRSIVDGIFKDEDEFNEYLNKWNQLSNAKVSDDGMYDILFKTSDGMILDSVSFLSEYQYTGKPLLFLTRPEQKFTPYGENLIKVLYTTEGSDFHNIEMFIENVLLNKQDVMKEERRLFFEKYLEYYHKNCETTASEAIYRYIISYFTDSQSGNHK